MMKLRFPVYLFLCILCTTSAVAQKSEPALGKMDYQIKIAYSKPVSGDTSRRFYTQIHTLYFGKQAELNIEQLPTSISKDPKLITLKKDTSRLTKSSIAGNDELKSAYNQASLHSIHTADILNRSYQVYQSTERYSVKNNGAYAVVQNDTLPAIKWTVGQKEKEIMGVKCTIAVGEFRGRKYTAWFAKHIPVPAGPWKLGGLPGLILEAADSLGEVIIELNALEVPTQYVIEKPRAEGKVISQSEFIDLQRKKNEQTAKMLRAADGVTQKNKPVVQTIRLVNMEVK